MYAPKLYDLEVGRDTIQEFRGYNHNLRIGDNEFFDMQNMTGKYYPLLSPRAKRGVDDHRFIYGICGKDKLVTIEDFDKETMWVCYDGERVFELEPLNIDRQLISMGAYVIIFPDMMYLNTADLDDFGSCFGASISFNGNTNYTLFCEDGTPLSAMEMMWGEEFFPKKDYYIDPLTTTSYKLFGIPQKKTYKHGYYDISYTYTATLELPGLASDQAIFSISDMEDGVYLNVDIAAPGFEEWRSYMLGELAKGVALNCGTIKVTATIDDKKTYERTFNLKAAVGDGNVRIRSGVMEGDRRMYYNDGATKSQICIRTENSPEATYATPSCWRDENTRVRIEASTDFVESLKKLLEAKEGHVLHIASAVISGKGDATSPLLEKYSNNKNLAINNVTVVSGTEVDILGYLDFYDKKTASSGTINLQVNAIQLMFDYMIEANNRLWACRYGTDYKGDFVNEIYASARGSFRSFFKFDGTADDSYVLSLGSGGEFTGAANLNGNPVFFKEGFCHTIYGSYPSSYSLSTEPGTWVASGSHKSICVDEGTLFFHGKDGIYAYDGASKQLISTSLGTERYKNAVGGCVDGKYYVSMQDTKGKWSVFVFDRASGMWHREDDMQARFFAPHNGDLYIVDTNHRLVTVNGTEGVIEGAVEWYAESGKIGYVNPDYMTIGRIQLKMSLPFGSSIRIYLQYDSDGYWEFAQAIEGKSRASFTVPIMPRTCDHFSIKLCGIGDCKVFSMTKTYEAGGTE